MTKPRYPSGCSARSQDQRETSSPAAWAPDDNVWNVNSDNGNANNIHRNNTAWLRVVRSVSSPVSGEYQGADAVSMRTLYDAWRRARKNKAPSGNQVAFDTRWIDGLVELQESLSSGTWSPSPATCFIAQRPKARQIHAPDFSDRVVHHWLVPQLEAIFEPGFIHDSFANRRGKGSHAAVARLQSFVRQVSSGEGGGWFLQLDVANFFNTIHRSTLYSILKRRMERAGLPLTVQRATHALLRHSVQKQGVIHRSTEAERAMVPRHKRLENAPTGCGVPIGNLSSQFFANVLLNELDQFVKHQLRAARYLRYVDDFVLVHRDRAQLDAWRIEIERFLRNTLRLELKADVRLRPLSAGIDFLGYVVFPTYARVRRRVVSHARVALADWERMHVDGERLRATPAGFRHAQSLWASYQGHFRHANAWRLQQIFHRRFPWLATAARSRSFSYQLEGRRLDIGRFP